MKTKAYILKKLEFKGFPAYRFSDYLNDPDFYQNYFSITCLLYHPQHNLIFCGLTAYNNDILYTFDPDAKEFKSCNYQKVAEKYEVKIHHSLELDTNGKIYGATACLHDVDEYLKAPGGAVFHFDPDSGKIEKLAVPVPHNYIQSINLDKKRKIIYGITYPVSQAFRYDLNSKKVQDLGFINCFPEQLALDQKGNFWGSWYDSGKKRLNLWRYDPDTNKTEYLNFGLPTTSVVSPHYGKNYDTEIDRMIDGEDGYLYIGTELGMLFRLNPESNEIKYLGKPCVESRLPALAIGSNGLIYGVGGDNYRVELFAYDRGKERFYNFGIIGDTDRNELCFRPHDICITKDKIIYVAETDTPTRSAYLWECEIDF